jgi:hypothetical protein
MVMKNKTKKFFTNLREKLPLTIISRDHVRKLLGRVIFPMKKIGIGTGG